MASTLKAHYLSTLFTVTLGLTACNGGADSDSSQANPAVLPAGGNSYTLALASYLDGESGTTWEMGRGIEFDSSGNIYITGGTTSPDFPVTPGAADTTFNTGVPQRLGHQGPSDVFVMKFDPNGVLLWSTFLGGSDYDRAYAIEVDREGNVYVAGRAGMNFPTTEGVIQREFGGDDSTITEYGAQDGFISKLSADGSKILWSTYFGASGGGFIRDIDIDAEGNVYVGGAEMFPDFPHITADAHQKSVKGAYDGTYAKISADGRKLLYGTFMGGTESKHDMRGPTVRVGPSGEVFLSSFTDAPDIPVDPDAPQTKRGDSTDIAIYKYLSDGQIYPCSYYGGNGFENQETHSLALDSAGNVYITGETTSTDLLTTRGSFQPKASAGSNAFIAKFSADCKKLIAATYIGGNGDDVIEGIVVDPSSGNVYVSGNTTSTDFPVTANALQTRSRASNDGFIMILPGDLHTVIYSTLTGGNEKDVNSAIALGPHSEIASTGETRSSDLPSIKAIDKTLNGTWGAFYFRLDPVP